MHKTTAKRSVSLAGIAAILTTGILISQLAPAAAGVDADPFARGQAAIERLGERLPSVAQAYGMSSAALQRLFQSDSTLAVDGQGQLAYIDVAVPGVTAPSGTASTTAYAPSLNYPEFQLASLPGADKTIYLDFDGHVTTGTSWNSSYGDPIVTNPYDTNGNFDVWSTSELSDIRNTWAAVAEDYAPWNINVTTIEPPLADLAKSGTGDTKWGARVVITKDTFANCGCGGFAYVGSFTSSIDTPSFVFNTGLVGVAEAVSHEVGHMVGLSHDGTSSTGYYTGHSSSDTPGWAPIMGAGYYQPVTQWSKGEYLGANQLQDDTTIIGSATNGFGLRADDHGDSAATATPFNSATPSLSGMIGTRADVDVFSFTTLGGAVTLNANPASVRPNLDITLTLRDSLGQTVTTVNPPTQLAATVSATLNPGSYTLEVSAVGIGNPLLSPPTGFTDYANIGQYTVSGTISNSGPTDSTAPAAPTGLNGSVSGSSVNLVWNANSEPDLAGYVVKRAKTTGGAYTDIATVAAGTTSYADTTAPQGDSFYVVVARDNVGNTSTFSSEVTVSVPFVSLVESGQLVAGTSSGAISNTNSSDGVSQTISESLSGGSARKRYDLAEYRWTIPASVGNQQLSVVASVVDGGDGDSGIRIEWSSDGATWTRLATVSSNVNTSYALGAPTGKVIVRVIDTNRTSGNTLLDRISVDLLKITGDGVLASTGSTSSAATASLVSSTQSGPTGTAFGVATVTVTDDHGTPIAGASVTVSFGGSFSETVSGTTDSSGVVVLRTSAALKNPTVSTCVATVANIGPLLYQPGASSC